MQNGKRPAERRRIGPAMQWAKSRSDSERAHERTRRRIDIDLELDAEWDSSQQDSAGVLHDYSSEQESRRVQSSTESFVTSANNSYPQPQWEGEGLQPRHNSELNFGNAWDYYSGNRSQDVYESSFSYSPTQSPDYASYNQTSYERPAHTRSDASGTGLQGLGSESGKKSDKPGLRQLLPPIVVVAIIIIVAFLSSTV